ncbi:hypothetical protein HYPSUDRAFT_1096858 [Hypholoma sublateritium FD-334 SS-4]|uniref:Uncharacterized protein n=1 Tax=Hypholoma sublateritium (strain FD-334 SS-4) TaxID=945553 RepID=A0A0D2KWG4_HYPSF|nr:hypothetical protein HYPSUDRAFT_1096858 [Hypholoma sublateritium FD-334 SS-4]
MATPFQSFRGAKIKTGGGGAGSEWSTGGRGGDIGSGNTTAGLEQDFGEAELKSGAGGSGSCCHATGGRGGDIGSGNNSCRMFSQDLDSSNIRSGDGGSGGRGGDIGSYDGSYFTNVNNVTINFYGPQLWMNTKGIPSLKTWKLVHTTPYTTLFEEASTQKSPKFTMIQDWTQPNISTGSRGCGNAVGDSKDGTATYIQNSGNDNSTSSKRYQRYEPIYINLYISISKLWLAAKNEKNCLNETELEQERMAAKLDIRN